MLRIGDWTVRPTLNRLERDGTAVKLEPRTMDLLVYLAAAGDRVVTTDELLRHVWQGRVFDDGIIYKRINQLRKALGDDPQHPTFIATIPKRGYRLIATITRDETAAPAPPANSPATARAVPALAEQPPLQPEQSRLTPSKRWLVVTTSLAVVVALSAFAAWRSGADARLTVTGEPFVFVTTEPGDELEPAWSPDGRRVAFVGDVGLGRTGIFVTEIGSTERMLLTSSAEGVDRSPRWSPVKPEIAFLRQQGLRSFDLMLVPSIGVGEAERLVTLQTPTVALEIRPLFGWAPDGRLVFSVAKDPAAEIPEYSLCLLSPESGAMEPLGVTAGPEDYDTSPSFSPDGRRLAFVRLRRNERWPRLMVQELDDRLRPRGAPQLVPGVPQIGNPHSPVWSPDGTTLTFMSGRQIFEWQVGGRARAVYSAPLASGGMDLFWSAGRARAVLALSPQNLDIWALPLDPSTHVAPLGLAAGVRRIDSTAGDRSMDLSSGGGTLAFISEVSGLGQLWLADADGGRRRQLTDLPGPIMSIPQWSPDNRRIAFSEAQPAGDFITYVIDAQGGLPQPLFNGYVTDWSADGEYLYAFLLGNPTTDFRYRLDNGEIETLPDAGVESFDATDLLYAKAGQWGIFARGLAGGPAANPERLLVTDYYPARGKIVAVEGGFYYVGHSKSGAPRSFKFYDFATGETHVVADAPKSIDIGMEVSPDGRELLFAAQAPGSGFDLGMLEFIAR